MINLLTHVAAIPDKNHEALVRLLEIMAPGERDLVALFEAYFDESYVDKTSILTIAGYLFTAEQCRVFDLRWKAVLDRFELPFFRMSACAPGNYPFEKLTLQERIEAQTLMIALIREHILFGAVVSVNEEEYNTWVARNTIGSAYACCCWQALAGIRNWLDQHNIDGDVAYFFEAGHARDGEANALMNQIFSDPDLRKSYRYGSHSFVQKEAVRPVQAPDILAWLTSNTIKKAIEGKNQARADLLALLEGTDHWQLIVDRQTVDPLTALGIPRDLPPNPVGITGRLGSWRFHSPF